MARAVGRAYTGRRILTSDLVYAAAGAVLVGMLGLTAWHGEWVSDTWIHAATISEVARHPLHPHEPLTGESVSFAYFSPWAMTLGWLMRLTGLPVFGVLTLAGLAATAALLITLRRLVRALTDHPWAPVLCLALVLWLWGTGTWFWSGFPSIGTLSVGFTWPSVVAVSIWFELWRTALLLPMLTRRRRRVAFLLLPGLVLLIHPFTALIAVVAVTVTLVGQWRGHRHKVLSAMAWSIVSGVGAWLWPWIDLRSLLTNGGQFTAIHHVLYLPESYGTAWLLVPLTAPALIARLARDRTDALGWTAAICGLGVLVGGLTGQWSLGRLGPGMAIPGQLALGIELLRWWDQRAHRRSGARSVIVGYGLVVSAALAVGINAGAWTLARAVPESLGRAHWERATHAVLPYTNATWITAHVRNRDVAVTNSWQIRRQLPALGLHVVLVPWPSPGLPDQNQRFVAEQKLLSASTPAAERDALIARYGVRWIIWQTGENGQGLRVRAVRLVACGPQRVGLYRIDTAVTSGSPAACTGRQ